MVHPVEAFLSNYPEEIQHLTRELRAIARRAMPGSYEFLYYDAINYSLSDSPLGRICYIRPLQKRVTLGFLFGRQLDDPHHLLKGAGKRTLHINVKAKEDASNPALEELIRAAWADGTNAVAQMKQHKKKQMRPGMKQLRLRTRRRAVLLHSRTKRAGSPKRKRG